MDCRTDTAHRIVDVATEMVQTCGYHAFSYGDIARRVGVRTASIHYHFPNKENLGAAVMARYRAMLQGDLAGIDEASPDPVERLQGFVALFLRTLGNSERLCPCYMLAAGQDSIPAAVQEQMKGFFGDAETWLKETLEAGRQAGRLTFPGSASRLAHTLFAALEGAMVSARTFNDPERLREAAAYLLDGLQPADARALPRPGGEGNP